jgi:DNA topoisomerase-1
MAKASKSSSVAGGARGRPLVIVESPAKAKTINRYLGRDFVVKASMGHVRDLPKHGFGVDVDHDFRPDYEILSSRRKVIGDLKKTADHASEVYLATDLDREGEAIAWHLGQALGLPPERTRRVIFNEITASAIRQAFAHPKHIDIDKVNAQQARRILDRIVGYELSPLLWQKIAKGLSAGRVQSVAVRLVVEREQQIRAFEPEEFWRLTAYLTPDVLNAQALRQAWHEYREAHRGNRTRRGDLEWLAAHQGIRAELVDVAGEAFRPRSLEQARQVAEALGWRVEKVNRQPHPNYKGKALEQIELLGSLGADSPQYLVRSVETRRVMTRPGPPFITASLQQSAATQLGFSTSKTMRVAQALYEGMDIGEDGPVGLITYMRTDSTNLSAEAVAAARAFIADEFGRPHLPERPNTYKARTSAQEAHEAIRPTDVARTPQLLKGKLGGDHWKLYDLIWRKFVACQMKPAEWDSTVVAITADTPAGQATLKAGGRRLVFDGFLRVMGVDTGGEQILPPLSQNQPLAPLELEPSQHFTSPPPRYTEASLVKALEAEGIGRPSTYATIIQTIQDRGYVEQKDRKFWATSLGELVTGKLLQHFPRIMDVKFTSHMESRLDAIEESHVDWIEVLREFYEPFKQNLEQAERQMHATRGQISSHNCPECGKPLAYRWSKTGRFLACTRYPKCQYTCNVDAEGNPTRPATTDQVCARCGKPMILRAGRGKPFLGCSGYPECDFTMPCDEQGHPLRRVEPDQINETCDDCGSPMVVKFKGRSAFLGCSNYPECRGTKPLPAGLYVEPPPKPPPEPAGMNCPDCGKPMVIRKGRRGPFVACSGYPRCRKTMPIDRLEELKSGAAAGQPAPDAGAEAAAITAVDAKTAATADTAAATSRTRNGRLVVESLDVPVGCPECGSRMQVRLGRWGPFMACTAYPRCKGTARLKGKALEQAKESMPAPRPKPKAESTDIVCPECGSKMMVRMSRRGRFLGCSGYPKCRHTMELPADLAEQIRKKHEALNENGQGSGAGGRQAT